MVGESVYNDKLGLFNVGLKLCLTKADSYVVQVDFVHCLQSVNYMLVWPVIMSLLKVTPWITLCNFPLKVNSHYCGHPRGGDLVSVIAKSL